MQNNIFFFGYGAYRDLQRIVKILGHNPTFDSGAILTGFDLRYQGLTQIPEPAKSFLNRCWGEEFKAYTLNPGNGIVAGVVWEINEADLEVIKQWEFDGIWRQIINVGVKTYNGKEISAITEKAINSQENEGFYDGLNYPNNINPDKTLITDVEEKKEDVYKIEKMKQLRAELKNFNLQV